MEDSILTPVSAEEPCGPNLEYDAAFAALERAMQGKPEQQVGTTIVPAQEPDWPEVRGHALEVLARSKDLRAASGLAQALLRTGGMPAFADGLSVLRGLIERYWETLHPRLDPEDGNDPTMRVNILMGLAEPGVLTAVRSTPLVASRALGRFCLRDIEVASGEAPPVPGKEAPSLASIEAAAADGDLAALEEMTTAARVCVGALSGIETFVAEQVGMESAPTLGKLTAVLKKASVFLGAALARRQQAVVEVAGDGSTGNGTNGTQNGAAMTPGRAFVPGEISSREEVLRALDTICRYYAKHEPSSPIPMFLERCQRLVSMNFVDIVRDLVPDALRQVEVLKGGDKA